MTAESSVEVLLATYNGAAFVQAQVESVLAQQCVRVTVTARDDGSSDGTVGVLDGLAAESARRMTLLPAGAATGSAGGNFAELLRASTGGYVALCDQDDVWQPGKLAASMERMRRLELVHGAGAPLLVFTDLAVVDEALRPVATSLWANNRIDPRDVRRLGRLLGENVVTGCTCLLNRAMVDLAMRMPRGAVMHDHWIALLACTLGRAAWLATPTVLYRQHGANAVGAAAVDTSVAGTVRRGVSGVERRRAVRAQLETQARAFLDIYASLLSPVQRETLTAYGSLQTQGTAEQWRRMVRYGFWRGTWARNVVSVVDVLRGP